jgi:hypothetical protein
MKIEDLPKCDQEKLQKVIDVMKETELTLVCGGRRDGTIALCFGAGDLDIEYMEEVSAHEVKNGRVAMWCSRGITAIASSHIRKPSIHGARVSWQDKEVVGGVTVNATSHSGEFIEFGIDSMEAGDENNLTYSTAIIKKDSGFLANVPVELIKLP